MDDNLQEEFPQVMVWSGTVVGFNNVESFENWMKTDFGVRVKYLEEIKTLPSRGVSDSGGRNDLFFAVHKDDISKMAVKRFTLQDPPRWIEDVLSIVNYHEHIYPDHVFDFVTWNEGNIAFPLDYTPTTATNP
jgi:hypothetical protein